MQKPPFRQVGGTPTRVALTLHLQSAYAAPSRKQMHHHLREAELAIMKLRRLVAKTMPPKPRAKNGPGVCSCSLKISVEHHRPR